MPLQRKTSLHHRLMAIALHGIHGVFADRCLFHRALCLERFWVPLRKLRLDSQTGLHRQPLRQQKRKQNRPELQVFSSDAMHIVDIVTSAVSHFCCICPDRCCAKRLRKDKTFSAKVSATELTGTGNVTPILPANLSVKVPSCAISVGLTGLRATNSNCKWGRRAVTPSYAR